MTVIDKRDASGTAATARKAAVGSFVGTAIEWYDFFIYGTAAALVLGPQFFPGSSDLAGTLAAFATLAVGFVARPIGGVVMGHFGDKVGRKSMLVISLLLMGCATVAIGLLPNYAAIGVAAPILLVALRFVQGLGVGGEWGGAVLVATENAPAGKRGLYGAAPQIGVPAGVLLANLVFLPLSVFMDDATFDSWGWRVPFLLSAVLVGVAMWIRLGLEESAEFQTAKDETVETHAKLPIVEVLTKHWKTVLLAGGTFIATNGIAYAYMVYVLKYGEKELGFSQTTMLSLLIASCPVWMAGMAFSAWRSDLIGRRTVYIRSSAALVIAAALFFPLMDTASLPVMFVAMAGLGFTLGCCAGPQSALFSELFPPAVRYSGASLGYQIGAILGGGLAPMIATTLFAKTGTSWSITGYFVLIALISLVSILVLRVPSTPARPARLEKEGI
ncbi:MHS family MFS transporter [Rhodococcus sp. HM1]|uniref:MFS transporter n=1 Tax=unclassified Rhodococcus (in: high G+C Gram-positive bacteria) TaxID=192944 RepID=UPI0018CD8236|nr:MULTISPECIES: MFS transporter [unclassified Rhodococcus (in: high G+C Gram-positive bacteria)]MBH0121208.1 MHS family MFS transporter [Rhodococcus sp. CX]MCK8673463.1 MHS family MFS transporter [Rhodococcus sp. HM1]